MRKRGPIMRRISDTNIFVALGGGAIVLGSLCLSFELFALQSFHYYVWANNIPYKEPFEFLSEPAILYAFILTIIVILSGIILISLNIFYKMKIKKSPRP